MPRRPSRRYGNDCSVTHNPFLQYSGIVNDALPQSLVRTLLDEYDLLYLDPLDPAIRELGTPFLREAIGKASGLYPALIGRSKDLQDSGYHAQVLVENQTSLFFLLEGGRRIPLKRQGERYLSREGSFSAADLVARAAHVSPNALLRPVLQDYLLPTAAYIGGPAELAYFAQSEVLYSGLLGRMPVMMARNGFTLLDARSVKLMDRFGCTLPTVFGGDGASLLIPYLSEQARPTVACVASLRGGR